MEGGKFHALICFGQPGNVGSRKTVFFGSFLLCLVAMDCRSVREFRVGLLMARFSYRRAFVGGRFRFLRWRMKWTEGESVGRAGLRWGESNGAFDSSVSFNSFIRYFGSCFRRGDLLQCRSVLIGCPAKFFCPVLFLLLESVWNFRRLIFLTARLVALIRLSGSRFRLRSFCRAIFEVHIA